MPMKLFISIFASSVYDKQLWLLVLNKPVRKCKEWIQKLIVEKVG